MPTLVVVDGLHGLGPCLLDGRVRERPRVGRERLEAPLDLLPLLRARNGLEAVVAHDPLDLVVVVVHMAVVGVEVGVLGRGRGGRGVVVEGQGLDYHAVDGGGVVAIHGDGEGGWTKGTRVRVAGEVSDMVHILAGLERTTIRGWTSLLFIHALSLFGDSGLFTSRFTFSRFLGRSNTSLGKNWKSGQISGFHP